jgi:polyhydroxybutyrate depolymerase
MKYISLVLIFLLNLSCIAQQNIEDSITIDDTERTYLIHLPTNYDNTKSYPLVMVLHGALGSGTKYVKSTKFAKIGDREGFISLFPNGIKKSWADARKVSKASKKGIDDVKFLTTLIDEVSEKYAVNKLKIYVTGISNGGFMTQTLACNTNGKFAAFASIISSLPKNLEKKCKKNSHTPMLLMNGTADNYVPYKGGKMPKFTKGGQILSTPKTIAFWKANNDTSKLPKIEKLPNIDSTDGSNVVKHTYFKDHKAQVVLCKIIGGGHGVPGSYTKRNPRIFKLGYVNQDIIAEEEIWTFLKAH